MLGSAVLMLIYDVRNFVLHQEILMLAELTKSKNQHDDGIAD
jgi:hypothetical protein